MNGLSLQNDKKLNYIINKCQDIKINIIIISKPNAKWIKPNIDRVQARLR